MNSFFLSFSLSLFLNDHLHHAVNGCKFTTPFIAEHQTQLHYIPNATAYSLWHFFAPCNSITSSLYNMWCVGIWLCIRVILFTGSLRIKRVETMRTRTTETSSHTDAIKGFCLRTPHDPAFLSRFYSPNDILLCVRLILDCHLVQPNFCLAVGRIINMKCNTKQTLN